MSVSCLCLSDAFVHIFFTMLVEWTSPALRICLLVVVICFFGFCSHFPNDDIAIRSDS